VIVFTADALAQQVVAGRTVRHQRASDVEEDDTVGFIVNPSA